MFLAALFMPSLSLMAAEKELIKCQVNSPYLTGCEVEKQNLAGAQEFESTFLLRYKFDCNGHNAAVAIQTEQGTKLLSRSNIWQTAQVDGKRGLKLKGARGWSSKSFRHCSLIIETPVSILPSESTLDLWLEEARASKNLLSHLIEAKLVVDEADEIITTWTRDNLKDYLESLKEILNDRVAIAFYDELQSIDEIMVGEKSLDPITKKQFMVWKFSNEEKYEEGIDILLMDYPDTLQIYTLYQKVLTTLESNFLNFNRSLVTKEVNAANQSIKDYYQKVLINEIAIAQKIIERGKKYRKVISREFKNVLRQLKRKILENN